MNNDIHNELKQSGLASMFQMRDHHEDEYINNFIGKTVRFKDEYQDTIPFTQKGLLVVKHVQLNWKKQICLRAYQTTFNDTFGFPINPDEVEIVD